jgi:flagellar basal-body rod protein FlgG
MRALDIAATGMSAQQMRVEVISNNLANMSTTGYSPRRADFSDLHYQQVTRAGTVGASDGTIVPAGVQIGLGVRPAAVTVNFAQGALTATGGTSTSRSRVAGISRSRCLRARRPTRATGRFTGPGTA